MNEHIMSDSVHWLRHCHERYVFSDDPFYTLNGDGVRFLGAIADEVERLRGALQSAAYHIHLMHPHEGITVPPFEDCSFLLCENFRVAMRGSDA